MRQVRSTKKLAEALECYRMKSPEGRKTCQKKTCPYNNNDPECGYFCCSNNLLYDAVQRLLYQDKKIKRLERKIDSVWTVEKRR